MSTQHGKIRKRTIVVSCPNSNLVTVLDRANYAAKVDVTINLSSALGLYYDFAILDRCLEAALQNRAIFLTVIVRQPCGSVIVMLNRLYISENNSRNMIVCSKTCLKCLLHG